jgi:hypothetical protein
VEQAFRPAVKAAKKLGFSPGVKNFLTGYTNSGQRVSGSSGKTKPSLNQKSNLYYQLRLFF